MPLQTSTAKAEFAAEIRAQLIRKGSSVRQWARHHGYSKDTVYAAINGRRNGPLSHKILEALNHG